MKTVLMMLTLALGIPAAALAQAAAPLSLTLEQAIERGLIASRRVAEATARRDQAEAVVAARTSASAPIVSALAGYMRTNNVPEFGVPGANNQLRVIYPNVPDNYRTRLDVQWPLYTGGRVEALTAAARFDTQAASNEIDITRSDLRLEIARAFWTLVVAGESLRVVEESLARTRAHLRDVRNQLEAGLVPPNDVLTTEAQEARQRMLSIHAATSRQISEAELARLIGVQPGTSIQPSAVLEAPAIGSSIDQLVDRALEARPDRRALVDRLSATDARETAVIVTNRPTIGVAGGLDYSNPNPRVFPRAPIWQRSWDASVNVNWAVFDGGRRRADLAEVAAGKRVLQARLDELDSVVRLEISQRMAEIEASRAAIEAADAQVRAATEARRVVGERFTAGVAISTDLLDAQVLALQASLERVQAIANARLAEARLQRAVGQ